MINIIFVFDREDITCQNFGPVCECSLCYCRCNYTNSGKICRGRCGVHIIQTPYGENIQVQKGLESTIFYTIWSWMGTVMLYMQRKKQLELAFSLMEGLAYFRMIMIHLIDDSRNTMQTAEVSGCGW
ncbi:hypothetical protein CMV_028107 [Castanea mollissima]|uniref:Uncharacterized protein n=1 Tax=Castanea mollissima TaxID=60419 RepID=A0A8J4QGX2_9ROSI|nr:hypothetical protein CMV_028107 [Castanea mollissima]